MKRINKLFLIALTSIMFVGCGGDGKDKITINGDDVNNNITTNQNLLENNNEIKIDLNSNVLTTTQDNLKIYAYKKLQYLGYTDENGNTINIGEGVVLPDGSLQLEDETIIEKTYTYTNNGIEYVLENGNIYRIEADGSKYFISQGELDNNNNLISKIRMTIDRVFNDTITIGDNKYEKITNNIILDTTTNLAYSYYINENGLITTSLLYDNVTLINEGGINKIQFYIDSEYEKLDNLTANASDYKVSYMDCKGNLFYSFNNEIHKKNILTNEQSVIGKGIFSNEIMQLSGTENNKVTIKKNSVSPIETILAYNILINGSDNYINISNSIYQEVNSVFNYIGDGKIVDNILYFSNGTTKAITMNDTSKIENKILLSSGYYYTINNINNIYIKTNLSENYNYYKNGIMNDTSIIFEDGSNKQGILQSFKNIDVGQLHIDIDGNMYAQTDLGLCKIDKNLTISYLNTEYASDTLNVSTLNYIDTSAYADTSDYIANAVSGTSTDSVTGIVKTVETFVNHVLETETNPTTGAITTTDIFDNYILVTETNPTTGITTTTKITDGSVITTIDNATTGVVTETIANTTTGTVIETITTTDPITGAVVVEETTTNNGTVYSIDDISTKNVVVDVSGNVNMSYNGLTYEVYTELGVLKSDLLGAINITVDEKNDINIVKSDNSYQENLSITKEEVFIINGKNVSTDNILATITNDTTDRILLDYEIIDGNIVINTDDERLDGGNDYIIQGDGTILTEGGEINALEVINSTITKDFNDAPVIIQVSPGPDSLVLNNAIVTISFNKKIKEDTINSNSVKLKDSKGNTVLAKAVIGAENEIVIIPNELLLSNERYTVYVSEIYSLEGGFVMDSEYSSHFNTVTDDILKIVEMKTQKGSDNLPVPSTNITLILNHPIKVFDNVSTQYLILHEEGSTEELELVVTQPLANVIVIDPVMNLKNFSTYILDITLIEEIDIDGNPKAQTRTIVVGSDEMTYLQTTYPIEGALTYNIYEQMVLTYNNSLSFTNVISKNWTVKDLTDPSLEFQLTVSYDYAAKSIKLTPPANMKSEHTFQLLIPSIEDEVGNSLPASTLTFTSEDITPPELILENSFFPIAGEQHFDFHAPITIQFTEPIDPASVNINNVYVINTDTDVNQNLNITVNDNIISLDASSLEEHTNYEIVVDKSITDFNNNEMIVTKKSKFFTYDITPPKLNIVPNIIPIPDWDLTKGKTTYFTVTANEELSYIAAEQIYVRPVSPYDGTVDDLKITIAYDKITKTDLTGSTYEVDDTKNFRIIFEQFPRPSPNNIYYLVLNRIKDKAGNYITGTDVTYKGGLVDEFLTNFVPTPETNKRFIKFVNIDDTIRPYVATVINIGETALKVYFNEKVYINETLPTSFKIEDKNDNNIILDTNNATTDNQIWDVNFVTAPACQSKLQLHVTNVYDTSYNKFSKTANVQATDTDTFPLDVFYCFQKICSTNYSPTSTTVTDTVAVTGALYTKNVRHLEDDSLYYWDSSKNKIYRIYTDGSLTYIGNGYFATNSNYIYMDGGGIIKDGIMEYKNSSGQDFYKLTATDGTETFKLGTSITLSSVFIPSSCN
jgi:hypothetical protein